MPYHQTKTETGYTLIELLTALTLLITLIATALPSFRRLLTSQQLGANANQVLAMIFTARAEGAYRSDMLICSGQGRCKDFSLPDNQLILVADRNSNQQLDDGDDVIHRLTLPPGMTIQWRSFRGLPALRINRHGVAYYQNGHFLLCQGGQARKVILNFQAKARVSSPAPTTHCPPS